MIGATAPRLVSLNVGMPRDVEWQGRTVRTGTWGKPVPGARMVRRLNIDGDGRGDLLGHGGINRAVYVYQLDSYRYWAQQLGRDDFECGQFGENFTVQGLPDSEVCIGGRYDISDAAFEVRIQPSARAGKAPSASCCGSRTAVPAARWAWQHRWRGGDSAT
ncbi:MAG TPA: MOSC domain-containing protein [Streptosporangiaceae bacterium]